MDAFEHIQSEISKTGKNEEELLKSFVYYIDDQYGNPKDPNNQKLNPRRKQVRN